MVSNIKQTQNIIFAAREKYVYINKRAYNDVFLIFVKLFDKKNI